MIAIRWAASAAALMLGALVTVPVDAASPLAVSGAITNGTAGASLPANLAVTVVQLNDEDAEVARRQTESGGNGRFAVVEMDAAAGRRLVVGTDYLGVTYSTLVEVEEGQAEVTADLTIYEITEDDSDVSVVSDLFTVVQGEAGTMEVIQLLSVRNSADRTYVGTTSDAGRQVLKLPVTPGAGQLLPLGGFRAEGLSEVGDGVATGEPLLPGESSISYGYRVQVAGGWPLRRAIFYPTGRIDLLVDKSLSVDARDLRFEEQVTLEGKTYRRYRGGPFRPGEELRAEIGSVAAGSSLWWGLAVGFAAVLVALLARAFLIRKRRAAYPATPADRERLIMQIAELDEAFAAGSVTRQEYRRRRDKLKAELSSLTDQLTTAAR